MCGIAGFVDEAGPRLPAAEQARVLRLMTDSIRPRGPDEEGHFLAPGVALGARRLSIIDVAEGQQPVTEPSGRYTAVYNGEVYNFAALREELIHAGHRFRSNCDTEVIPHLVAAHGIEGCVKRLQGMFAFAVWDAERRELLLARDRLGIKPLYWGMFGGTLLFGSELKAVLPHPAFRRTLDVGALVRYLRLEYVPAPRSIYQGLSKLEPGHYLRWKPGTSPRTVCYWTPFEARPSSLPDRGDMVGWSRRLAALLDESVRCRLMSEVPLGALLSGGLDSSLTTALMARHVPDLRTFSIAFEEESYDERRFFDRVGQLYGTDHHVRVLRNELFPQLFDEVTGFLDEPFADGSIVPTWFLSKTVKEAGVTVVLSGDGADELFAGYPTYQAWRWAEAADGLPRPLIRGLSSAASMLPTRYENVTFDYKLKRFLLGLQEQGVARHVTWLGAFVDPQLRDVLAPTLLEEARAQGDPLAEARLHWDSAPSADPVERASYLDLKTYMGDDILVKVDRASMAASLEVRVPYLDHRVVELAAAMPVELKLRGGVGKRVLRRVAEGRLPSAVLQRPKKGFGLPIAPWLRGTLRPLLLDELDPARLEATGLFQAAGVRRLIDDHLKGRADRRKQLWALLMFRRWQQGPHGIGA